MELAAREAKARLSELIAAARKDERVVITKRGVPAAGLVRCPPQGIVAGGAECGHQPHRERAPFCGTGSRPRVAAGARLDGRRPRTAPRARRRDVVTL